jgi:large subunit ribosomal protein L24
MRKIRKGDDVVVVTGKDKGKRGSVVAVLLPDHVIVSGVNMIKRHTKPNPNAGVAGGIVEKEAPIHVSNVMMFNPKAGKGDRVGIKVADDGRKVRYFKSDSQVIDV